MPTKVWSKVEIRHLLETNNDAVGRGLVALFDRQTVDEKALYATLKKNNIGFNGADAKFLSSLARSFQKYGNLTERQLLYARRKIMKYCGQLTDIANGIR